MSKARDMSPFEYEVSQLQLFLDLSWITLQQRRFLQLVPTILRDLSIPYQWGLPFSLTTRRDRRSATLRYPEDLASFCEELHITPPETPRRDPIPGPLVDNLKLEEADRSKRKRLLGPLLII